MKTHRKRFDIRDMRKLAHFRGGKCLSRKYLGVDTKLTWKCKHGHVWKNRPAKIKKGQWCPYCSGLKGKNVDYLRELAREHGGFCLSRKYTGVHGQAKWKCAKGHIWEARPANVRSGHWCPICRGFYQTIDDMRSLARDRGGKCLSKKFTNYKTKLRWRCREGHEWNALPGSIKNGTWCPRCKINFGEEICRQYFEAIFKSPFPKARPEFLRSGRRSLELDGYCESLKIAFEHHGRQHYGLIKRFHSNNRAFERQNKRDQEKVRLANAEGVSIIEIPEVPALTALDKLPLLIDKRLSDAGVEPLIRASQAKVDLNSIYKRPTLKTLNKIAKDNRGVLLDQRYLGGRVHLLWRCKNGHEWRATPNAIKTGTWCPHCYGNVKKSLDDVRNAAKSRGITLISSEYRGTNHKMRWRCQLGHEWEASPKRVASRSSNSTGCPKCAGRNKTISDMNKIAKRHGVRCISEDYISQNSHLVWECAKGHQFKMTPNIASKKEAELCSICRKKSQADEVANRNSSQLLKTLKSKGPRLLSGKVERSLSKVTVECYAGHKWTTTVGQLNKGVWCGRCAAIANGEARRLGIKKMKTLARTRGGMCLSEGYVSIDSKLNWQCSKGHEWSAIPSNIIRGQWCPFCSGRRKTARDMVELATKRGFRFLSDDYYGDAKSHLWECSHGHQWQARPTNISQGRGCPTCSRARRRGSRAN